MLLLFHSPLVGEILDLIVSFYLPLPDHNEVNDLEWCKMILNQPKLPSPESVEWLIDFFKVSYGDELIEYRQIAPTRWQFSVRVTQEKYDLWKLLDDPSS